MNKFVFAFVALAAMPAGATTVFANNPALTHLGIFAAGSYAITATGTVGLTETGFTIRPNGTPDSPITEPGYAYFNPSGSPFDAAQNGNTGPGGAANKLGALLGSFNPTPSAADYFLIGAAKNVVLSHPGSIYAVVNDTYYSNNINGFEVNVTLNSLANLPVNIAENATVQNTTTVFGNKPTLTNLGSFAAGRYIISATGTVGLTGSGFTMRPDGTPDSPITEPGYIYFNPSGSPFDAAQNGNTGPGGTTRNLGTLLGSFTETPGLSDYFQIGYSKQVVLSSAGNIYALVNDTYYSNNIDGFNVTVAAVPEPASWAMMIAGFGLVGALMRRRSAAAA